MKKILIGTDTTSGIAPHILDAIAKASHIKTMIDSTKLSVFKTKQILNSILISLERT